MPKISVIIPVYNTEKYIDKCLNSIVNQTMQDIEIICVDDGSTDKSLRILNEYASKDNRIKILTQSNSGAAKARNKGLSIATGEYLYFIDSDDFIDLTFCEKMYNQAFSTDSDICICKILGCKENRSKTVVSKRSLNLELIPDSKKVFNINDFKDNFYQFCAINIFNKIFRKSLVEQYNIEFQDLKTCNDVFFYVSTLAVANAITFVDEPLITSVRERVGSISFTRGQHINSIIHAAKFSKSFLEAQELFDKVKKSFYERMTNCFYYEYTCCANKKLKKDFIKEVKEFLPKPYLKNFYKQKWKTFMQNIFSIKNSSVNGAKIITILWIKINCKKRFVI